MIERVFEPGDSEFESKHSIPTVRGISALFCPIKPIVIEFTTDKKKHFLARCVVNSQILLSKISHNLKEKEKFKGEKYQESDFKGAVRHESLRLQKESTFLCIRR